MKFHVLTAVSRPWNLVHVGSSITGAMRGLSPEIDIAWHCRFDISRKHVGGQRLKNEMLDDIKDGWVVILDDDTGMHRRFFLQVVAAIRNNPEAAGVIVSQKRTDGEVLVASAENAVVGGIDAGQAVLRRDLIGDWRLPETYAGDGIWLEKLLRDRDDVIYLPAVLSLHNLLSGIAVSEPPERMTA